MMLVSGMIIGSLFTLFVVPSIYMLIARKRSPESSREEVAPRAPLLLPAEQEG
jgi:multidrug efflux pump